MIKVNKLNKYYNKGKNNEIHVINNTTLELPSTGLISFLGQSGSGKTTLLNCIGGLDRADGSITYDDIHLDKYRMRKVDNYRREEIGYVFQGYNLLTEETVYNNLVIALEMVNIYDKAEQAKRIEYVLKAVGMFKYRKKKAGALSGGQQQRISIARALVKSSKIIIADEPTGNLDHENTITIMNILKKISKNTLVLMVTHNVEIAEFYSNRIFVVKDGSIEKSYEPNSDSSLSHRNSNNIYLKDLNKTNINSDKANIEYYDENDSKPLNLRVVFKNGTYYIESDSNIKLVDGSNIKLLDKHYEEITKNDIDDFTYDNSWFKKDSKGKNIFKSFIDNIKISYHNMRAKTRRTKILYASFFIIGVLCAICTITLSNAYTVDESSFQIDPNQYAIYKDNEYWNNDEIYPNILEATKNDDIKDLNQNYYLGGEIEAHKSINERILINVDSGINSALGIKDKLLYGKMPEGDLEMVISKGLAKKIVKHSSDAFKNIEELIGVEVRSSNLNKSFVICGINDNEYIMSYLNDPVFLKFFETDRTLGDNYLRSYELENKYGKTYKVLKGRDLNSDDDGTTRVLAPASYMLGYKLGEIIEMNGTKYEIVGFYELLDEKYKNNNNFLMCYKYDYPVIDYTTVIFESMVSYMYKDITVVAGRMPAKNKEILASIYAGKNVGDTIGDYTIVGLFNGGSDTFRDILYSRDIVIAATKNYYGLKSFSIVNEENMAKYVNGEDIKIDTILNITKAQVKQQQWEMLSIFASFGVVLMVVITIFIYFIMRSRMIAEIYPLGVYRSLGAPKRRIYSRYFFDVLVLVSLTSVIGFVLTNLFYLGFAQSVNAYLDVVIAKYSLGFTFGGVAVMYLVNIIFGLLPAHTLMKKTPAEILSKYDI